MPASRSSRRAGLPVGLLLAATVLGPLAMRAAAIANPGDKGRQPTRPAARRQPDGDLQTAEGSPPARDAWPQFRGPTGQGLADDARPPLTWSESDNVLWKAPVPGAGWSSPVIDGSEIWLTTATEGGKSLRAACFDAESGQRQLLTRALFQTDPRGKVLSSAGHASPTPVLGDGAVFCHFGAHGTACLDRNGQVVWKRVLAHYHHHGPAASPILVDDTLVIVCDGHTGPFHDQLVREDVEAPQFVVGLDPGSGDIRWKTARPGGHSYCTPLAIRVEGQTQVVCPGGDGVRVYDPADGRELWSCRYSGHSVVPRPVASQGLIFVGTGYHDAALLAIREGAAGDCTATGIAWKLPRGAPYVASPLAVGDYLYLATDEGIVSCVAIRGGKVLWKERLGGRFYASPLAAAGRLYLANDEGTVHVLRAGPEFEVLARNQLEGKLFASPAAVGERLYLRTEHHLYCLTAETGVRRVKSP